MIEELDGIVTDKEAEAFETFFFLVFYPNPLRDNVKIIIDDGTIRTTLRRKKFHAVIEAICGLDLANSLDVAMSEMGGWFLFDRENRSIKKLQNTSDYAHLHIKDVIDDSHKMYTLGKKRSLYEQIMGDESIHVGMKSDDIFQTGKNTGISGASYIHYDPSGDVRKSRKR